MKKQKACPIPAGFTPEDIRIESSICTGEKTIGFYSRTDKRLHGIMCILTIFRCPHIICKGG